MDHSASSCPYPPSSCPVVLQYLGQRASRSQSEDHPRSQLSQQQQAQYPSFATSSSQEQVNGPTTLDVQSRSRSFSSSVHPTIEGVRPSTSATSSRRPTISRPPPTSSYSPYPTPPPLPPLTLPRQQYAQTPSGMDTHSSTPSISSFGSVTSDRSSTSIWTAASSSAATDAYAPSSSRYTASYFPQQQQHPQQSSSATGMTMANPYSPASAPLELRSPFESSEGLSLPSMTARPSSTSQAPPYATHKYQHQPYQYGSGRPQSANRSTSYTQAVHQQQQQPSNYYHVPSARELSAALSPEQQHQNLVSRSLSRGSTDSLGSASAHVAAAGGGMGALSPGAEHAVVEGDAAAKSCTAFISKVYHMVEHLDYSAHIRWSADGTAFVMQSSSEIFTGTILPRFFRHNNVASLIRQLNLYGFVRLTTMELLDILDDRAVSADQPLDTATTTTWTGFRHPNFQRNRPDLLKDVRPKVNRRKRAAELAAAAANAAATATDRMQSRVASRGRRGVGDD